MFVIKCIFIVLLAMVAVSIYGRFLGDLIFLFARLGG
jgi:hypothetical protein